MGYIKTCRKCHHQVTKKVIPSGEIAYLCENSDCPLNGISILVTSPISIKHIDRDVYSKAVVEAKRRGMTIGAFVTLVIEQYFGKSKKFKGEADL
jgi:hypothetical protein